jgi:hypothetical protein
MPLIDQYRLAADQFAVARKEVRQYHVQFLAMQKQLDEMTRRLGAILMLSDDGLIALPSPPSPWHWPDVNDAVLRHSRKWWAELISLYYRHMTEAERKQVSSPDEIVEQADRVSDTSPTLNLPRPQA